MAKRPRETFDPAGLDLADPPKPEVKPGCFGEYDNCAGTYCLDYFLPCKESVMADTHRVKACPACGDEHFYRVAHYEPEAGAQFNVVCPATLKMVEVTIPAASVRPGPQETADAVRCAVCGKANYLLVDQHVVGTVQTQRLRCANKGCEHETARKVDVLSGIIIAQ